MPAPRDQVQDGGGVEDLARRGQRTTVPALLLPHCSPLGRLQMVPIPFQLGRSLPEGVARHQHIGQQAEKRDGIRQHVNGRDDVEQRNNQDRLRVLRHLKLGVAEHLVGELYILQIRFESLPFRREELLPFGAKLVEHAWAFGLRLPGAIVENVFDLRFAAFWRSHRCSPCEDTPG